MMTGEPEGPGGPAGPALRGGVALPKPAAGRLDADGIVEAFAHRMMYSVAKGEHTATLFDAYTALAFAIRDRLMERWFSTQDAYYRKDAKRVYYLSMEFLMGRALRNNVLNLGAEEPYRTALQRLGYDLDTLEAQEWDAGLGNGGLGRLAACFLDSAATLALPFYGYGIRYEYGIFTQRIEHGHQIEAPDNWLRFGNPWEIRRPDALYPVQFYGRAASYREAGGPERFHWVDAERVMAMAHDVPILGYANGTVNTLRLWAAKSTREFDLARFNAGEYVQAVEDQAQTESISKVLYPADAQYAGKELRLKQQYFCVSATLQDVIRRFKKVHDRWDVFPDKVALHLNETHPAIAVPELIRVLVDGERVEWDEAWSIAQRVFGYTNHTILPEALETWSGDLFGRLLPRHLQIVEEIDRRFRSVVRARHDEDTARRLAIVADDEARTIRMAHLAIVGSHSVNGVSEVHTRVLTTAVFPEFHALFPGRFHNKTNGISPRRWLLQANPALARLVSDAVGDGWVTDLDRLAGLAALVEDAEFRRRWTDVKRAAKVALADTVRRQSGLVLDPDTLFDCQVKRIHEYKRQLLNALRVIALYHRIRDGGAGPEPRRTVIFAGKAAPGYALAKLVIKLIHAVAELVNRDPQVAERLRVVFLPNYGVSAAERIFPACELSEQISTAGTEASGTGNMKAALNGALTIGTLDGANIEIRQEVGRESMFVFGHTVEEVGALRRSAYDPVAWIDANPELRRAVHTIAEGEIGRQEPGLFAPIVEILAYRDRYLHCADFASYLDCQDRVAAAYLRADDWARMSIRNVAGMGRFSSDRTVREYARQVWGAVPVPVRFDASGDGHP
jgi:starch phosphorylase